jgi:MoaA/NifB/PqqE/SkfB family radical SAM enzyme
MFVELNRACNLRCAHCDYWMETDDEATLPDHQRLAFLISEFAALSPHGTIVTCGGEPMLRLGAWFEMARLVRKHGLSMFSVSNGTRIRDAAMAERVIREGPHEISISLNAATAAEHDRTRGVSGAFEKTTKAIRLLVEARQRLGLNDRKIIVMGLVYAGSYRNLPQFYDFVLNDLKADKLKLNMLQPTFRQSGQLDPFFASEYQVDPDELATIMEAAAVRHGLDINTAFTEQAAMYFRSLAAANDLEKGWQSTSSTREHICNTYDRNIMVDLEGIARLCFSTGFRGEKIEKTGDLKRFWDGTEDIRQKMRVCNRWCGISHSVRKESATLSGVASAAEFARLNGAG